MGGRRQITDPNTFEVDNVADCPWTHTTEPHYSTSCIAWNHTQAWPKGDHGQETETNFRAAAALIVKMMISDLRPYMGLLTDSRLVSAETARAGFPDPGRWL